MGILPGRGGRLDVQPDLTLAGYPGVFGLGDFANIIGANGKPLPQLGSVAEQSDKWCAKHIAADIEGSPREPFRYSDRGIMAMIGRNAAVAEVGEGRHELDRLIGFAAWLGVHVALLSTCRARVVGLRGMGMGLLPEETRFSNPRPHHRGSDQLQRRRPPFDIASRECDDHE